MCLFNYQREKLQDTGWVTFDFWFMCPEQVKTFIFDNTNQPLPAKDGLQGKTSPATRD